MPQRLLNRNRFARLGRDGETARGGGGRRNDGGGRGRDDDAGDTLDDLLDDDDDGQDDDDSDDEDDEPDDDDNAGGRGDDGGRKRKRRRSGGLTADDLDRAMQRLEDKFSAEVDRRVNQIVRKQRSGNGETRRSTQDRRDAERVEAEAQQRLTLSEARNSAKDYLSDEFRPVSPAERDIANALIANHLAGDEIGDPVRAGRVAARETATALTEYRKSVERATIKRLRAKGLLKDREQGGGDQAPGSFGSLSQGSARMVPAAPAQVPGQLSLPAPQRQRAAGGAGARMVAATQTAQRMAQKVNAQQGYVPAGQDN